MSTDSFSTLNKLLYDLFMSYTCLYCQRTSCLKLVQYLNLSDYSRTWTHNPLVWKWTLNNLAKLACSAKWLNVHLWTKWLWYWALLQSLVINDFKLACGTISKLTTLKYKIQCSIFVTPHLYSNVSHKKGS